MAVPVSDRRDSNSGGRSGRLTVKPDMAVVMTTPCHPFTMASQSFIALEQPSWLPHGRHLEPGAPLGAFNLFIVRTDATSGAAPASLPCIPPSSLIFRWDQLASLTLSVAGERFVPFLAPWSDQGRALRPDQDPAATRCGFLLLAIIDGNAAAVCAAVCGGFVGL